MRGKSPLSNIIRYFDEGGFSHVAIAMSQTHIMESQYLANVRIKPFYFNDYEILDLGMNDEHRNDIVRIGVNFVGSYKYDYIQITWYILSHFFKFDKKTIWNSPNNLICSELIDLLLLIVGIIPEHQYVGDLTPNQLYRYLKSL